MIAHHHKLIFVHVPKCAGMAVEAALGGLPVNQRPEQHFSGHDYARYHPDLWSTYERFAVVRHPLARCLSFVRFFRRFDPVWRRQLGHVDDRVLLEDLLMSHNLLTAKSCAAMLTGEEHVLHLESLAQTWAPFAETRGLPEELPAVNASRRPATAGELPPRVAWMVAALFHEDFTRFGYALPATPLEDLPLADQGAVHWARLRAWARDAGRHRTQGASRSTLEGFDAWVAGLPDTAWQTFVQEAVEAVPMPAAGDLVLWTEQLHERANVALGKPLWMPWSP